MPIGISKVPIGTSKALIGTSKMPFGTIPELDPDTFCLGQNSSNLIFLGIISDPTNVC